jgi:hypothetical protein
VLQVLRQELLPELLAESEQQDGDRRDGDVALKTEIIDGSRAPRAWTPLSCFPPGAHEFILSNISPD